MDRLDSTQQDLGWSLIALDSEALDISESESESDWDFIGSDTEENNHDLEKAQAKNIASDMLDDAIKTSEDIGIKLSEDTAGNNMTEKAQCETSSPNFVESPQVSHITSYNVTETQSDGVIDNNTLEKAPSKNTEPKILMASKAEESDSKPNKGKYPNSRISQKNSQSKAQRSNTVGIPASEAKAPTNIKIQEHPSSSPLLFNVHAGSYASALVKQVQSTVATTEPTRNAQTPKEKKTSSSQPIIFRGTSRGSFVSAHMPTMREPFAQYTESKSNATLRYRGPKNKKV